MVRDSSASQTNDERADLERSSRRVMSRRAVLGYAAGMTVAASSGVFPVLGASRVAIQGDTVPTPLPIPAQGVVLDSADGLANASAADLAATLRVSGEDDLATSAMAELLARVGVRVWSDADGQQLRAIGVLSNPLEFMEWQVRSLARDLHNGVTIGGGDLDAMVPDETTAMSGVPRPSELLAAWVRVSDGPGAEFARAWMGDVDIEMADGYGYPAAIVTIFSAEFMLACVSDGISSRPYLEWRSLPNNVAALQITGCGQAEQFISTVLGAIENAIEAGAAAVGLPPFLMKILGFIVGSIATAAELLLTPVLGVIRGIGAALSAAGFLAASLTPWTVKLVADPQINAFGTNETGGLYGKVTVSVEGFDTSSWPAVVTACASLAGVTLPPNVAAGAVVEAAVVHKPPPVVLATWAPPPAGLEVDGTAMWDYVTMTEPAEWATEGEERIGIMGATVTVTRDELLAMRDAIVDALFGALPGFVGSVVQALIGGTVQELTQKLVGLASETRYVPVFVRYHEPPQDPPAAETTGQVEPIDGACHIGTFTGGPEALFDPNAIAQGDLSFAATDGSYTLTLTPEQSTLLQLDYVVLFTTGTGESGAWYLAGSVVGSWTLANDTLTIDWNAGQSSLGIDIFIEGIYIGPLNTSEFIGSLLTTSTVTCTSDGMILTYQGAFGPVEAAFERVP